MLPEGRKTAQKKAGCRKASCLSVSEEKLLTWGSDC